MENEVNLTGEYIEKNWPLSQVSIGEVLQKSTDRTVGIINSKEAKFVYKITPVWKDREGVTKYTAVFEALANKGFEHAPKLLKSKTGNSFCPIGNTHIYLLEYISGENPPKSIQTYQKLGEITAQLHSVKEFLFQTDFDTKIIVNDLIGNSKNFDFGNEYRKVLEALPDFEKLPKTVIHTDIAPSNSIQKSNGQILFIDWDDAGLGPTVLDLGSLLNEVIDEDLHFRKKEAQAFYQTYFSKITLSEKEVTHIFDAAIFFACMYIIYGNTKKRWTRINWMLKNRKEIEKVIRSSKA